MACSILITLVQHQEPLVTFITDGGVLSTANAAVSDHRALIKWDWAGTKNKTKTSYFPAFLSSFPTIAG